MKLPTCEHRVPIPESERRFLCSHPQIRAPNDVVTAEMCRACPQRGSGHPPKQLGSPAAIAAQRYRPKSVAVIIPCHNYAHYLAEAIRSALGQTRGPQETLVVDDGSTDNTGEVVRSFASEGVKYLHVDFRQVQRTRRAGFAATRSEAVCFLDADDVLSPDYLELGLAAFDRLETGIVYSDVEFFGERRGRTKYRDQFDAGAFSRMNYLHIGCLVRREALAISRALEVHTDDALALEDWLLWRRVLACGWQARKQPAIYRYRRHGDSRSAPGVPKPPDYFRRASLAMETITLFLPLSGRVALWPGMAAFLERQTWPHAQTRLVLFDTSQCDVFSQRVRTWVGACDYSDVRHVRMDVGQPGVADRPRQAAAREVALAMARIYNQMARELTTDYVWVVEDDMLPPDDACERLLRGFDERTASISAAYLSRLAHGYVAWTSDRHHTRPTGGLQKVDGNGFGCVVLRGQVVRDALFTATIDYAAYDNAFYYRLAQSGLQAKIDWSVECRHVL
jgi:glycosyltransferase involved in cell wall biosynthesis